MSKVAICGFAPNTLPLVDRSDADQIWSMVWAYKYKEFPRIDVLFEMHPIWISGESQKHQHLKPRAHWHWLQQNREIEVLTLAQLEQVPRSTAYPVEQVTAEYLSRWTRSGVPMHLFTSSVDYMIALAMLRGFDTIEFLGVEMSSDSEFKYQREGFAFWTGLALGRGLYVEQHAPSQLLYKPKRYGYDGFQMVSRQDLETLKRHRAGQLATGEARLQYLEGQLSTAQAAYKGYAGEDPAMMQQFFNQYMEIKQALAKQREMLAVTSGALQNINYLIQEIDLEMPSLELANPFGSVYLEEKAEAD